MPEGRSRSRRGQGGERGKRRKPQSDPTVETQADEPGDAEPTPDADVAVAADPPAEDEPSDAAPGDDAPAQVPAPSGGAPAPEPVTTATEERYKTITSPMVGTFYRSPAPDADPYAEAGQLVEVGQTVCIIEAMKLMNEIESDVRGRVVEVLVENAQPVEYGQALLLIDPA